MKEACFARTKTASFLEALSSVMIVLEPSGAEKSETVEEAVWEWLFCSTWSRVILFLFAKLECS